jgi:hypothetical protein
MEEGEPSLNINPAELSETISTYAGNGSESSASFII